MEKQLIKREICIILNNLFWSFLSTRTKMLQNHRGIYFNFKKHSEDSVYVIIFANDKDDKKNEIENISKMILESSKHCLIETRNFDKPLHYFYFYYIQKEWKNKEWIYSCICNDKKEIISITICVPKIYDHFIQKIFEIFENPFENHLFVFPLGIQFIDFIESEMKNQFYHLEIKNFQIVSCITFTLEKSKKEFLEKLPLNEIEYISLEADVDIISLKEFVKNQNQENYVIKKNDKFAICSPKQNIKEIISLLKMLNV